MVNLSPSRAMFELPMRESIENEVRIEDAEPSAVEDMLEYVYTDGIVHLTLEVSPKNEEDFAAVSLDEGEFAGTCVSILYLWWRRGLQITFRRRLCRLQMRSSSLHNEQFMNALYFSGSYMVMMKEVGQACRVKKGLSPARSPSLQSPRRVAPCCPLTPSRPLNYEKRRRLAASAHVLQINAYQDKGPALLA